jgi:hypothetical protein
MRDHPHTRQCRSDVELSSARPPTFDYPEAPPSIGRGFGRIGRSNGQSHSAIRQLTKCDR